MIKSPISNEETKEKELSWELLKLTSKKIQLAPRKHLSVDMGEYIVILEKRVLGEHQVHSILDTKKKVIRRLRIVDDDFQRMEYYSAWHWKNNKIVILGQKRIPYDTERTHMGWLTIPDLRNGTQEITASFKCFPVNRELKTYRFTGNIYKDKLYVVESAELKDTGRVKRIYSVDLVRGGSNLTLLGQIQESSKIHKSYIFQDILYIFPKLNLEFSPPNVNTQITFNINTSQITTVAGEPSLNNKSSLQSRDIDGTEYLFAHKYKKPDYETLWIQDLETQQWEEHSTNGMTSDLDERGSMTVIGEKIYIIGGGNDDDPDEEEPHDIWCLSLPPRKPSKNTLVQPEINLSDPSVILKLLFTEAPYHDITFEVESELIPAHKWLLTKRSRYFANMFSSGMVEAQASKIIIPDMKARTLRAFIEFLYTNKVELDDDLAFELFQQADKYLVPELKSCCEKYLCNSLNPENYVNIANLAEMLDASELRKVVVAYITKNIITLRTRKDHLAKVSNDILKDVVLKINGHK